MEREFFLLDSESAFDQTEKVGEDSLDSCFQLNLGVGRFKNELVVPHLTVVEQNENVLVEIQRRVECLGNIRFKDFTGKFPHGVCETYSKPVKYFSTFSNFYMNCIRKKKMKEKDDFEALEVLDSLFQLLVEERKKYSSLLSEEKKKQEKMRIELEEIKMQNETLSSSGNATQIMTSAQLINELKEQFLRTPNCNLDYSGYFSHKIMNICRRLMYQYSWNELEIMAQHMRLPVVQVEIMVFFILESSLGLGRLPPPQWFDRDFRIPTFVSEIVKCHFRLSNNKHNRFSAFHPSFLNFEDKSQWYSFPAHPFLFPTDSTEKIDKVTRLKIARRIGSKGYITYEHLEDLFPGLDRRTIFRRIEESFPSHYLKIPKAPVSGIVVPIFPHSYGKIGELYGNFRPVIAKKRELQSRIEKSGTPTFHSLKEKELFFSYSNLEIIEELMSHEMFRIAGMSFLVGQLDRDIFYYGIMEDFFKNSFLVKLFQLEYNSRSVQLSILLKKYSSISQYEVLGGDTQNRTGYFDPSKTLLGCILSREKLRKMNIEQWKNVTSSDQRAYLWRRILEFYGMKNVSILMSDGLDLAVRIEVIKKKLTNMLIVYGFNCGNPEKSDDFKTLRKNIYVLKSILSGIKEQIMANGEDIPKQRKFLAKILAKKCVVLLLTSYDGSLEMVLDWIFTSSESVENLKVFMDRNIESAMKAGIRILYFISDAGMRPVQNHVARKWKIFLLNCLGHLSKAKRACMIGSDNFVYSIEKEEEIIRKLSLSLIFEDSDLKKIQNLGMNWEEHKRKVSRHDLLSEIMKKTSESEAWRSQKSNGNNNNENHSTQNRRGMDISRRKKNSDQINGNNNNFENRRMNISRNSSNDNNNNNSDQINGNNNNFENRRMNTSRNSRNDNNNNSDQINGNNNNFENRRMNISRNSSNDNNNSDRIERNNDENNRRKKQNVYYMHRKRETADEEEGENEEDESSQESHPDRYFLFHDNSEKMKADDIVIPEFEKHVNLAERHDFQRNVSIPHVFVEKVNLVRVVVLVDVSKKPNLGLSLDGNRIGWLNEINPKAPKCSTKVEFERSISSFKQGFFSFDRKKHWPKNIFRLSITVHKQLLTLFKRIELQTNCYIVYYGGFLIGGTDLVVVQDLYERDVSFQSVISWASIKLVSTEKQKESLLEDLCKTKTVEFLEKNYSEYKSLIRTLKILNKLYIPHLNKNASLEDVIGDMNSVIHTLREMECVFLDFPESSKRIFTNNSRYTTKLVLLVLSEIKRILEEEGIVGDFEIRELDTTRIEGLFGRIRRAIQKASSLEVDRMLKLEVANFRSITDPVNPINENKTARAKQFYRVHNVKKKKKVVSPEYAKMMKDELKEFESKCGSRVFSSNQESSQFIRVWKDVGALLSSLTKSLNTLRCKTIRQSQYVLACNQELQCLFLTTDKKNKKLRTAFLPEEFRSSVDLNIPLPEQVMEQLNKFKGKPQFEIRKENRGFAMDIETSRSRAPRPLCAIALTEIETGITFKLHVKRDYVMERMTRIHGISVQSLSNSPLPKHCSIGIIKLFKFVNCDNIHILTWNGTALDNSSFAYLWEETGIEIPSVICSMVDLMFIDRNFRRIDKGDEKHKSVKQSFAFKEYGCKIEGNPDPQWHMDVGADAQACREIFLYLVGMKGIHPKLDIRKQIISLERIAGLEYTSFSDDEVKEMAMESEGIFMYTYPPLVASDIQRWKNAEEESEEEEENEDDVSLIANMEGTLDFEEEDLPGLDILNEMLNQMSIEDD